MEKAKVTMRKTDLTGPRRRLVALMQAIDFGQIKKLVVRDGEPDFHPSPRVVRKIKIGSPDAPRAETELVDFALKSEVEELFRYMDQLGTGIIRAIEIRHGLPFSMEVETDPDE